MMEITEQQKNMARFWKKFMRLTRGRVTALRALDIIAQEEKNPVFQAAIADMRVRIEKGSTFTEAVAKHPDIFSLSVRELVNAAEKSGAWDEVLLEIVGGLEEGTFD